MKNRIIGGFLAILMIISVIPSAFAADNTMASNATKLELDSEIAGEISENSGFCYYTVKLEEAGTLRLHIVSESSWVELMIQDEREKSIWSKTYADRPEIEEAFILDKGTYYIRLNGVNHTKFLGFFDLYNLIDFDIVDGFNFKNVFGDYLQYVCPGEFTLSTEFESANESFEEDNNALRKASEIEVNTEYNGLIAINDDSDYYKFELTESGTVSLDIKNKLKYLDLQILDENEERIYQKETSGKTFSDTLALNKGLYYIVFYRDNSSYVGTYSFTLEYDSAGSSFDGVDNDSMKKASEIEFDTEYKGIISENNSLDYYKFTLPNSGKIDLSIVNGMSQCYYKLYDENNSSLAYDIASDATYSKAINLTQGTYFLQMQGGAYNSYTGTYSFTLNYESANSSFDGVDNDSIKTASEIEFDTEYKGIISENNSLDYYKFILPNSGKISLDIVNGMSEGVYQIYDSNNSKLVEEVFSSATYSDEITLTDGTYYLSVRGRYNIYTGTYSFTLKYKSADEAFEEVNNSFDNASEIELGEEYNGLIATNDKVDYYKFSLSNSGTIDLTMKNGMSTCVYQIYDSNNSKIVSDVFSNATYSKVANLTAGTYYLSVRGQYDIYTGTYSFTIDYAKPEEEKKEEEKKEETTTAEETDDVNLSNKDTVKISFNKKYDGKLTTTDNEDYYYFSLSGVDSVKLSLNSNLDKTFVKIYDEKGNEKYSSDSTKKELETTINLEQGNYYLRVYGGVGNEYTGTYSVKVSKTVYFVDVHTQDYFYSPVHWAAENGITSGTSDTTFSPDKICTRGDVVTFLWRANGSPKAKNSSNKFKDVISNSYYAEAVKWAVEEGITSGTSKDTFSPNDEVTRSQFATFLWRANGKPTANASNKFNDVTDKNAYYYDAVMWVLKEGITSGTSNNTFSPNGACSRGQVVTFLYRNMK